jgi:hypothetical protein
MPLPFDGRHQTSYGFRYGVLSSIHFVPFRDDFDVAGVADPGEKRTRFRCDFSGLSEPGYTQPILVAFPSLPPNAAVQGSPLVAASSHVGNSPG